jgi:hypothetical protein
MLRSGARNLTSPLGSCRYSVPADRIRRVLSFAELAGASAA